MKIYAFAILLFATVINAQSLIPDAKTKHHTIFLAIPENDTSYTFSPKYALSVGTTPGSYVTVNGKEYKLYPTGVFAGLLDIHEGENLFSLVSVSPTGETAKKSFLIIRNKVLTTLPSDSLVIESSGIEPSKDLWLDAGDILNVKFKGTPGCKATFLNGKEIHELPLTETNGVGGIYQGTYRVKPGDVLSEEAVKFKLEDKSGKFVENQSKGKISFKSDEFPLAGRTKGERPFLNYGLGEDRLGGAKLSFLNPGIKIKINGKAGNQFRVSLAGNQQAWIPVDQVDLLPKGTFMPYSLTSNWTVYGNEKFDYVTIGLNEKLPYTSVQDPEKNRIVVDVHGAVANTNWITQHLSTKEIKNVFYEVPSEGLFRIVIELKHKQIWGYGIEYQGNSLVIRIKHQPEKLGIENLTFALDAGHGGTSLGALGATSAREKDVNLNMVYILKDILEKEGAKVILTRKNDTTVANNDRLKAIFNSNADILISIHSNSIGSTSDPEKVKGISTYYKHICYRPLSTHIYSEVLKTGLEPFGNVGNFNFALNSPIEIPNVLVELGFMSNPEDEMKLLDDDFRRKLAKKIVKGVEDFLESCEE